MNFNRLFLGILVCWWTWIPNISGREAKTVAPELSERVLSLIRQHEGTVAVSIHHIPTGETFQHNCDLVLPTASLIKFPILVTAHHEAAEGRLNWDEPITVAADKMVPGSGVLTDHFSAGTTITVRDAARLMIVFSDNTATNLVVEKIGLKTTAKYMEQLGLKNTKLHSQVFRGDTTWSPERSKQFGLGSTTAKEMVQLFEMLWTNQLGTPEVCEKIKGDLFACDDRTKIARHLPPTVKFAHKTGEVSQSRCDAGVMDGPAGPTIVCVLSSQNVDQSWTDESSAHVLCAEIGRAVYTHFHAGVHSAESGVDQSILANGATGPLVVALQRTLNKRLTPSPNLSLDGDFGPATENAVIDFQKSHGNLPADGIVNAATWSALGPLETEDEPVPIPDEINVQVLAKMPADPADGLPFVTSKAWVVMDAETGKIVGSDNSRERLDIASTTKIMTAYVVLECCQRHPDLLDETLVFSKRADDTVGSTCGIAAGEKVVIRELLYGLLLPSGNDASVALAEFFGRYVQVDQPNGNTDQRDTTRSDAESYDRFIQAMNETALELGMDASFQNPHGLTATDHVATAESLAVLARAAMKIERFREVVSTRQRGCTLDSASGYTRNVVWMNTNQLLATDGYVGIKTGTTNAAGACLVSYGRKANRDLITVTLGASSSDARYVDTRNLFRWAWNELSRATTTD